MEVVDDARVDAGRDGRVRGWEGSLVIETNAVGRWLLEVAARGWGLGGRVAMTFGRVRVEDLDVTRTARGAVEEAPLPEPRLRAARGERGSVVTLLCDGGERYGPTYYDDAWLAAKGLDWQAAAADIAAFLG